MLVNVHSGSRMVVAVCDSNLFGRKFEDNVNGEDLQLDLTGKFFEGEKKTEEEVEEIIQDALREDASFNFVGENSCKIAKRINVIKEEGIIKISGIPVALVLL